MREIRRKDRAMPEEDMRTLLEKGEYGVLSTVGPEGLPYGVPLSYIVKDGALYFHCAHEGRKVDNLRANPQVTFTVIGATRPVYDKNFTTYYECAMVSGTAEEVADPAGKREVLMALAAKYLPEHMNKAGPDIQRSLSRTAVYRIRIERMTGKAKRPARDGGCPV